jgi:hypothetical protein
MPKCVITYLFHDVTGAEDELEDMVFEGPTAEDVFRQVVRDLIFTASQDFSNDVQLAWMEGFHHQGFHFTVDDDSKGRTAYRYHYMS